ncbi:hypothetical protein F4859DRAFT_488847 [Xylaria cf. heliscus]|nr:hypothetical protein F4859DRAFT_488847 [Xylaria cf. heliscus]
MMDPGQVATIQAHPLGAHLNSVCTSFKETAQGLDLDTVGNEVLRNPALCLLPLLQNHPVSRLLPSRTGCGTLRTDLLRLKVFLDSGELDLNRIRSLLNAVLRNVSETNI